MNIDVWAYEVVLDAATNVTELSKSGILRWWCTTGNLEYKRWNLKVSSSDPLVIELTMRNGSLPFTATFTGNGIQFILHRSQVDVTEKCAKAVSHKQWRKQTTKQRLVQVISTAPMSSTIPELVDYLREQGVTFK